MRKNKWSHAAVEGRKLVVLPLSIFLDVDYEKIFFTPAHGSSSPGGCSFILSRNRTLRVHMHVAHNDARSLARPVYGSLLGIKATTMHAFAFI